MAATHSLSFTHSGMARTLRFAPSFCIGTLQFSDNQGVSASNVGLNTLSNQLQKYSVPQFA
jgi:hypothetical protein